MAATKPVIKTFTIKSSNTSCCVMYTRVEYSFPDMLEH